MKCYLGLAHILLMLGLLGQGQPSLHNRFKDFEILKTDDFVSRSKRDSITKRLMSKTVTFSAFQRNFVLSLNPGSPVLHPDFEALLVNDDGTEMQIEFDRDDIYTGYVNDNPEHTVHAAYMDGVWLAQIRTPDSLYSVEPLNYHEELGDASSMIVFRMRDIQESDTSGHPQGGEQQQAFCEQANASFEDNELHGTDTPNVLSQNLPQEELHRGYKRDTYNKNHTNNSKLLDKSDTLYDRMTESKTDTVSHSEQSHLVSPENEGMESNVASGHRDKDTHGDATQSLMCELLAIADYHTFKGIGKSSARRVLWLLVHLYQRVSHHFLTQVQVDNVPMGIFVKGIHVHRNFTYSLKPHYNLFSHSASHAMTAGGTLAAMTGIPEFKKYCLVHLTTQRHLDHIFGSSFRAIAADSDHWERGVCASKHSLAFNLGLSTLQASPGHLLGLASYSLVVTHHIAHNWGSADDPGDDVLCSPAASQGGKYLMWRVPGMFMDANSDKFSPCSLQAMQHILRERAPKCFVSSTSLSGKCGNGIVEPHEDCDSGLPAERPDRCCTSHCRFRENATCSPGNHPCCTTDCSVAPPTQECFAKDVSPCRGASFCSGLEAHACPRPSALPDNTPCKDGGKCWSGKCISYCRVLGLSFNPPRRFESCSCDSDVISMCQHCCRDLNTSVCHVTAKPLKDGTPCLQGWCQDNVCQGYVKAKAIRAVGPGATELDFKVKAWCQMWMIITVTTIVWISISALLPSATGTEGKGKRQDETDV